jgi:hypothetical protein
MLPGTPYEDDNFVELPELTMPSAAADYYYVYLQRKSHGDLFRLLVKDREQLAAKVLANDWDIDPRNARYDPDYDYDYDEDDEKKDH